MKISVPVLILASSFCFAGLAHADSGRGSAAQFFVQQQQDFPSIARAAAIQARNGQIVRASWYGGGERLNKRTSTGEIFHPMGHTAAHRTLPLGTMLRVSLPGTGRSTVVRVNDRGPAAGTGRSIDLSRGAALDLGLVRMGSARVMLEVMR